MWLKARAQFEFFLLPWSPPVVTWNGGLPVATFIRGGQSFQHESRHFLLSWPPGAAVRKARPNSAPWRPGDFFYQP